MPELALLRFVVLDDDYIGDDFIGQYTIAFECLQPGYRNVPLLCLAGEPLPHASLFVHVAITNRRGGGKAHRRGLSVKRGVRRGREYVTLRNTAIKVLDDTFRSAGLPLREATDLRENALVSVTGRFPELLLIHFTVNISKDHYSFFSVLHQYIQYFILQFMCTNIIWKNKCERKNRLVEK